MVGEQFVSWWDPTVVCESVWDGRYLLPQDHHVVWPSSLTDITPSRQPAKRCLKGQAPSGLVRTTAMSCGRR